MVIVLYYIGQEFYWKSGTTMSSLYNEADGRRWDYGFLDRALADGHKVEIRQATVVELEAAKIQLADILLRSKGAA